MYIDFDENGRMKNVSMKYFENSIEVKDRIIQQGNIFYLIEGELVFFENYNLRREKLKNQIEDFKNTAIEFKNNNSLTSSELNEVDEYIQELDSMIQYYNNLSVNFQEQFHLIIYTDETKEHVNDGTSHLYYLFKPLFIEVV